MASPQSSAATSPAGPLEPPPEYFQARIEFAHRFLTGKGLEIGALNLPLEVPAGAEVSHLDRVTREELEKQYPEYAAGQLPEVDIVDNGESLATIAAGSQDFIVANHFLEHTEDPIGTIETHLGKLKPGGVLFYAVPDKRYTFDFLREVTPLEHMIRDHEQGPDQSRRQHYEEFAQFVVAGDKERERSDFPQWVETVAGELEELDHSIHFHVWTETSFLALLIHCHEHFGESFELEALSRRGLEVIVILRKGGAEPAASSLASAPELKAEVARLEVELLEAGRELQRVKGSPSWRFTEPLRAAKARLHGRR